MDNFKNIYLDLDILVNISNSALGLLFLHNFYLHRYEMLTIPLLYAHLPIMLRGFALRDDESALTLLELLLHRV